MHLKPKLWVRPQITVRNVMQIQLFLHCARARNNVLSTNFSIKQPNVTVCGKLEPRHSKVGQKCQDSTRQTATAAALRLLRSPKSGHTQSPPFPVALPRMSVRANTVRRPKAPLKASPKAYELSGPLGDATLDFTQYSDLGLSPSPPFCHNTHLG